MSSPSKRNVRFLELLGRGGFGEGDMGEDHWRASR